MVQHEPYREVEAKLWVEDLTEVAARLLAQGATLRHARVFERNIRYEDAANTLTGRGIVLRLRQDSIIRLTFKGPLDAAQEHLPGLQSRFEAEVAVDSFDNMAVILRQLGYRPYMLYEKYRTTYRLGEAEIVLDEMPYGRFVEVEGSPEQIELAVSVLGLTECTRFGESYAQLFDYVRANLGLTFHDLTFENFAGIHVPLDAFRPPGDARTDE
jgi:adenylate cyclase class 2